MKSRVIPLRQNFGGQASHEFLEAIVSASAIEDDVFAMIGATTMTIIWITAYRNAEDSCFGVRG